MVDRPRDLAVALRDAALSMIWRDSADDVEETMDALVLASVGAVPGAVAAAVSQTDAGVVSSRHATGDLVSRLDDLQTRTGEGPSPAAAAAPPEDGVVCVNDLRDAEATARWPELTSRAVQLGARSVLWIGLPREGGRPSTGLVLWADRVAAFDTGARLTAGLFAAQAGVLLHGARSEAGLNRELATRDVVGQAQGLLMERFGLGPDSAFEQLVKAAREADIEVPGVARSLVEGAERRELQNRAVEVSTNGRAPSSERGSEPV